VLGFLRRWRTRTLQTAILLAVFLFCFLFIDQTRSEVTLINRASYPIMIEEMFFGNKIENPKMEPFGFEYIHMKDSDVLQNYVPGPDERIKRTFRVSRWRLF